MQDRLQLHRPSEFSTSPAPESGRPSFSQLQQAAEWFALLRAEDTGQDQVQVQVLHQRWQQWLEQDALHRAAWQRVETVNAEFGLVPTELGHQALARNATRSPRRRAIKTLAWLAAGVTIAGSLGSSRELRSYLVALNARFSTGVGQTSRQMLADGSILWLNTASAADADFDEDLRRVVLRRGELMIQSAHDSHLPARPLVVDVPAGRMQALGTRFLVRLDGERTRLTVLEGRVRISPAGQAQAIVIEAGQQVHFDADHVDAPQATDESLAAWSRRLLMPDGMRLDEFLAELSRYRHGYLGCAPQVAGLRLVGVYPVDDTDRVLDALQASLPVKVRRILPWWVTVEPA